MYINYCLVLVHLPSMLLWDVWFFSDDFLDAWGKLSLWDPCTFYKSPAKIWKHTFHKIFLEFHFTKSLFFSNMVHVHCVHSFFCFKKRTQTEFTKMFLNSLLVFPGRVYSSWNIEQWAFFFFIFAFMNIWFVDFNLKPVSWKNVLF